LVYTCVVIPGKFTAFTKSTATGQKLKEQVTQIKELYKYMEKKNWK